MKNNNIEDKFFCKRIVKAIFAKVNISAQINKAKQLGVEMARDGKSSEYGDSRWNALLNETYKMVGGDNTDQGSNVGKQLREAWKSANEKEQKRIDKIQQDATFKLEATVRSLKSKLESKGFCSNKKNCSPQDKALQQEIGEAFSYETSNQQFISLIRKMNVRLGQPFGASKNYRTGGKTRFAWTKELGQKIQALKKDVGVTQSNLRDLEKKGDHNNCVGYCQSLSSLYSQLGKAFGDAARNSMKRTGGKFKFGKEPLDYGDFTTKGGQTYTLGYTENSDGTYTAYLHSGMDRVNRMRVCKTWEEFQFWAKEIARKHNAVSQEVFARTGGKAKFAESPELKALRKELKQLENKFFEFPSDTRRMAELKKAIKELRLKEKTGMSCTGGKTKFSARVDTDSIKRWVNEYGGNINSDKNRGAWAFTEVNTGETIVAPISLLFKEAVSWLRKNGKQNSTYKVAL